jgi:AcrR family transcriptional regulator
VLKTRIYSHLKVPKQSPLKPRKLPQQHRSTKMVEQILTAAARSLVDRGLEGFNTNAIAEQAAVSVGSLYQYFSNKDTLTATLIRRNAVAFLSELQGAIATAGESFDDRRRSLVRVAVTQQLSQPQLAKLLDIEESRLPLDQEIQATQLAILAVVAMVLGEAGYDNISERSQDLVAMSRGMIDAAGTFGETDQTLLESRVCRAIFGYLGHPTELIDI